jgi:hypothetical protein
MDQTQWQAGIRRCLAAVERQPARAVKMLDVLIGRVRAEAAKGVGDWHVEQTLHTVSIVQSHLEQHRESAAVMLQLAGIHEEQATYHRRAFVCACATAALELTAAGDVRGARRVLQSATSMAAGLRPAEKLFQEAQAVVDARHSRGSGLPKPRTQQHRAAANQRRPAGRRS